MLSSHLSHRVWLKPPQKPRPGEENKGLLAPTLNLPNTPPPTTTTQLGIPKLGRTQEAGGSSLIPRAVEQLEEEEGQMGEGGGQRIR